MADFDCVPIVDVTQENINDIWPSMVFCLRTCSFVAIDLELSGLGRRQAINAKSVEDRYKALSDVSRSRAIISFGISCFTERPQPDKQESTRYQVQTFNVICLCSEEYTVEPDSLKFLVEHGFNFNRQYASGLSYYRGSDKEEKDVDRLRQLFLELLGSRRPLVLHNGFVDLIFLYSNLYCTLPTNLGSFLADVEQMFPAGIYDTKFLAEFRERISASYLEYVFKKRQMENQKSSEGGRKCVEVAFMAYPKAIPVEFYYCKLNLTPQGELPEVCKNFASYGWCSKGTLCKLSHNIDHILCCEERKQNNKRRKKKAKSDKNYCTERDMDIESKSYSAFPKTEVSNGTRTDDQTKTNEVSEPPNICTLSKRSAGCHRAGYDAFMTGFVFATHLTTVKESEKELKEVRNKIYLCGKDIPLLVIASSFAKPSPGHLVKFFNVPL